MKIGHIEPKAIVTPAAGERTAPAVRAPSQTPAEPSAKVELSSAATLLASESTPEFDAKKVDRIAQAIREGRFEINADAIADKLIGNAQELLSRASR